METGNGAISIDTLEFKIRPGNFCSFFNRNFVTPLFRMKSVLREQKMIMFAAINHVSRVKSGSN